MDTSFESVEHDGRRIIETASGNSESEILLCQCHNVSPYRDGGATGAVASCHDPEVIGVQSVEKREK